MKHHLLIDSEKPLFCITVIDEKYDSVRLFDTTNNTCQSFDSIGDSLLSF